MNNDFNNQNNFNYDSTNGVGNVDQNVYQNYQQIPQYPVNTDGNSMINSTQTAPVKSKKPIFIIILMIIVFLAIVGVLFGTGKLKFSFNFSQKTSNSNSDSQNVTTDERNNFDGSKTIDVDKSIKDMDPPAHWDDASEESLLGKIKKNSTLSDPYTKPGTQSPLISFKDASEGNRYNNDWNKTYVTYGDSFRVEEDGSVTILNPKVELFTESLLEKLKTNYFSFFPKNEEPDVETSSKNLRHVRLITNYGDNFYTFKDFNSKDFTESILAATPDDYGTSYYYRGTINNNFVSFAGICWRIVRVDGSGNIKLVVWNTNGTCDDGFSIKDIVVNYNEINALNEEDIENGINKSNGHVGIMFGNVGSSNYLDEHKNINKSNILKNIENWYSDKLIQYDDKIADVIWCNDKSLASDSSNSGFGENITNYASYDRLYVKNKENNKAEPTLVCPKNSYDEKISMFTVNDSMGNGALTYKVGMLTADEYAFAGAKIENYASDDYVNSFYFNDDSYNKIVVTITPYFYGENVLRGNYPYVWGYYKGKLLPVDFFDYYYVVPSISLKYDVLANGSGTAKDPYIIK